MHRPPARRPRLVAGALITVVASGSCADDGTQDAAPTVVAVTAQPCRRPTRDLGQGMVVGDGLVLTAAHTVDGARRAITVDGRPATIVALDARTDLALLGAAVSGPPIAIAKPSGTRAEVATVDGPIAVTIERTGPLVVHDATSGTRHEREALTLRPAVEPGTSGAPVLDAAGHVLGVVVLDNRTDGTAYAVSGREVDGFLRQRPVSDAGSDCLN